MAKAHYALHLTVLCSINALMSGNPALAASRSVVIEGRIRQFECGDNCYLTIVDKSGREHTGLCTAPECAAWNRDVAMPARFKGRKVVVSTGRSVQLDGSGNVMGRMNAFKKIRFVQ
jgi:hypothetical protein